MLKEKFGPAVREASSYLGNETAVVEPSKIPECIQFLRDTPGLEFNFMMDLAGADYPGRGERFEVIYHLYSLPQKKRIRLKTRVPESNPVVPSITKLYKAANWFEREAYDLFGIKFTGHPNLKRILTFEEFEGHPLRKDYPINKRPKIPTPDPLIEEGIRSLDDVAEIQADTREDITKPLGARHMLLNLGPSHPAMHGTLRVLVELDGETIVNATPEIGYLHRCFEKECEVKCYTQVIPYTDRLNYLSPLMNNVGYCMAVEKMFPLEIPERAQWIRMLISEVSRITDHCVAIGTNAVDIGALTNFWYLFNPREKLTDWIEALCGARLTTTYTRIGGLMRDVPSDSKAFLKNCVKDILKAIKDTQALLKKNRILMERTQGIGAISKEDAISYGFVGPCLRAAGVDYDIRRDHPYYFYDQLDWDVPLGRYGDSYDRIFVRFEEMIQSCRMIEQILEKMPEGPIMTDNREVALPPKHEVYGSIEGIIQHFKIIMHGIKPPPGEIYSYTEAANGELGFYIVSDGSEKPYRIKVRPPCFAIYQAYPQLMKGHLIADAIAILGGLNIVAGELDR